MPTPDSSIKRISVRSGHGTGKDASASWIIAWFLTLHRNSKIVCTAPTGRQLSDILWSEISKWFRKSSMLDAEFVVQADKIFHKSAPKEWWCRAVSASVRSTKEEQELLITAFEEYANQGLHVLRERMDMSASPMDDLASFMLESCKTPVAEADLDDLI